MPQSFLNTLRFSLLFVCIFCCARMEAAFTTPEGIHVVFLGNVKGEYQNNVFCSYADRVCDETLILTPGIEITWENGTTQGLHFEFTEDFLFYNQNSQLNTHLANLNYDCFWHAEAFQVDLAVSFIQTQSNTSNVRLPNLALLSDVLVVTNVLDVPLRVHWDFSEPVYVKAAAEATMTAYPGTFKEIYNKNVLYQLPVNFYYRATDRFHIGVGYRFSYTDFNTIDRLNGLMGEGFKPESRSENFFNLCARTQFLDTLEMNAMAGWANVALNDPAHAVVVRNAVTQMDIFAFNAELVWLAADTISFYGNCSRDFGTGSNGQLQVITSGTLGMEWTVIEKWVLQASATYSRTVYQNVQGSFGPFVEYFNGQLDNAIDTNLVLIYSPTEFLSLSVGYSYQDNQSNQQSSTYMNNLFFGKLGLTF